MQNKSVIDASIHVLNNIPNHFDQAAEKYFIYKYGSTSNMSEQEQKEMDVLEVLEQLGFPMEETGTYFYKEIILKTMEELQAVESKEEEKALKIAMGNSYSQFYFDIARNNIDIGLKSFHGCVTIAYEDRKRTSDSVNLEQKIGIGGIDSDYRLEAVPIAKHIMLNNTKGQVYQTAVAKVKE